MKTILIHAILLLASVSRAGEIRDDQGNFHGWRGVNINAISPTNAGAWLGSPYTSYHTNICALPPMTSTNLNQVIIETIEQSKQVLGEGFDFAKEQTPLLIQEFLTWKFWEHSLLAVACFASAATLIWLARKWAKHVPCWAAEVLPLLFAYIAGCVAIPVALVFGFLNAKSALQVKIAPRVYLVEYAVDAIKGK